MCGISLNPKKSNFGMEEGKLFGHIISKEVINIDPRKVEGILKIGTPRSKKQVIFPRERKFSEKIHP
jgi:hypothetical protein